MVGSDTSRDTHRILKLDRTTHNPTALADVLSEDPGVYSEAEVQKVLEMVSSGNTSMVRTTTGAPLVAPSPRPIIHTHALTLHLSGR